MVTWLPLQATANSLLYVVPLQRHSLPNENEGPPPTTSCGTMVCVSFQLFGHHRHASRKGVLITVCLLSAA